MIDSTPIWTQLVPDEVPAVPEGFAPLETRIVDGLPHLMEISEVATMSLVLPSGLAMTWRDADPSTVVSSHHTERAPNTMIQSDVVGDVTRPPLRLLVRVDGALTASVPMVVGARYLVLGDTDARGIRFEIAVVSWLIHAGTLRGPGDFGSTVSVAWRPADQAIEEYSTPPINPHLIPRLKPLFRLRSRLGLRQVRPLKRFVIGKKVYLK